MRLRLTKDFLLPCHCHIGGCAKPLGPLATSARHFRGPRSECGAARTHLLAAGRVFLFVSIALGLCDERGAVGARATRRSRHAALAFPPLRRPSGIAHSPRSRPSLCSRRRWTSACPRPTMTACRCPSKALGGSPCRPALVATPCSKLCVSSIPRARLFLSGVRVSAEGPVVGNGWGSKHGRRRWCCCSVPLKSSTGPEVCVCVCVSKSGE